MASQVFHDKKMCYLAMDRNATGTLNKVFKNSILNSSNIRRTCENKQGQFQVKVSEIRTQYPNYFIFTLIRNPYDRAISAFEMQTKRENDTKPLPEEFLTYLDKVQAFKNEGWLRGVRPQTWYLDKGVNYIGCMDNFREEFEKLCDMLEISTINNEGIYWLERWKIHETERRPRNDYLNPDIIKKIRKIYDKDIELYKKVTND
jgi:hypothetical protein